MVFYVCLDGDTHDAKSNNQLGVLVTRLSPRVLATRLSLMRGCWRRRRACWESENHSVFCSCADVPCGRSYTWSHGWASYDQGHG